MWENKTADDWELVPDNKSRGGAAHILNALIRVLFKCVERDVADGRKPSASAATAAMAVRDLIGQDSMAAVVTEATQDILYEAISAFCLERFEADVNEALDKVRYP